MSLQPADSFFQPAGVGPVAQQYQPIRQPAPLAPGASWSQLFPSVGFRTITAAVNADQAGTIEVERFVDEAGEIPQGGVASAPLSPGAFAVLNIVDELPFGSFSVTVTNSGSAPANLSGLTIYQEAR